jgi:hypothetical protein
LTNSRNYGIIKVQKEREVNKMTKKELIEMLTNIEENEELTFVVEERDREGYPYDAITKVYKVLGANVKKVRCDYGIIRLENN